MTLTIATKGATVDVGRNSESTSDLPDKEKLLEFSKCC